MKYEEPNMELILIYEDIVTTSGGPLDPDEDQEINDSGSLDDLH